MADYKLYIDKLLDYMIQSDRAIIKYGGIAIKEGISFVEDGGIEKIASGIDNVKDVFGAVKGHVYTIKEQNNASLGGIEEKSGKSHRMAKHLIGTLSPIITGAGPAIITSVSPLGLMASMGDSVSKSLLSSQIKDIKNEAKDIKDKFTNIDGNMITLSGRITDLSGAMSKMNNLSWVSAGASVLNCGISVAGFALVLNQLNNIQEGLERIEEKLDKALIARAKVAFHNLMHYMQKFSESQFNMDSEDNLVQNLNEASQLIQELAGMAAKERSLDASVMLQLLLPLNVTFEKVVKEYSIKAFYDNHAWPVSINAWEETIRSVNQDQIWEDINFHMHLAHPESTEKELDACMKYITNDLIRVPALELKQSREFIEETGMQKDEYYNLPNEIMERINEEKYEKVVSRTLSEVYDL